MIVIIPCVATITVNISLPTVCHVFASQATECLNITPTLTHAFTLVKIQDFYSFYFVCLAYDTKFSQNFLWIPNAEVVQC